MRQWFAFALTAITLLVGNTSPLGAQPEQSVLFYDSLNGIIRELDASGTVVDSVQLPMPSGYGVYSFNAAFDDDFRYVAYVVSDPAGTRYQFRVYGYVDGETHIVFSVDSEIYDSLIPNPSPCRLFNDSGLVAFGYNLGSNGYFTRRWNLMIFDVNSGALKHSINEQYFPYPLENDQFLPMPYTLDDSKLTFGVPHMFDTPEYWSSAVYHWHFDTGEVMRARLDRSPKYDEAPERLVTLWQSPDVTPTREFFPNQLSMQVGNDSPQELYADPDLSFTDVYFVQDGARVLARAMTPTMERSDEQWLLLDLNGRHSMLIPSGFRADAIQSTPDGFLYTRYETRSRVSHLYRVNTTADSFNTTLIASDIPGRLIGSHNHADAESAPTMPVDPLFRLGDRVVITPSGNQLRMRSEPGGEVLRQFNAGTFVTIVGGPAEFSRTYWWQVRDDSGLVGWVAQGNSETNYLALTQ